MRKEENHAICSAQGNPDLCRHPGSNRSCPPVREITGARYRLLDLEESYAIEGPDLPAASSWPAIEPGYPFIYLPKDGTKPAGWILDYLSEREKDQRRREFFKAAGKKRGQLLRTLREQGQNEPVSPVPEYKMALFLASMRRGWSSDKKLYRWLQTNRQRAMEWIAANLGIAASSQVDAPVLTNSQVSIPSRAGCTGPNLTQRPQRYFG